MAIHTVGVLGCGLMGSGIAQTCAAAGYHTIVREVDDAALARGIARIAQFLDGSVARGKVTAGQREATLGRIEGTTDWSDLAPCDVVIEAVVEGVRQKHDAYRALADILRPTAMLASNTSSLSVTELAAGTNLPGRFVGLHFFYPVPLMKLVELIRGLATSDDTYSSMRAFAESLGKDVISAPDRPGFIVNRLLVPYLLDAIRSYEQGLGTLEDIDKGMTLGCGYPMGPFALLDHVGLDTIYSVANIMFDELREPALAPPPLLKRLVLAGRLGRKTGRGFYEY